MVRYIHAAQANGYGTVLVSAFDLQSFSIGARRFDAAIIWRATWTRQLAQLAHELRCRGTKIVYDIDDLMVEPELATPSIIDGIRSQGFDEDSTKEHFRLTQRAMHEADYGFTTTDFLAYYFRKSGKPTFVLPNGFDRQIYERSRLLARQRASTPSDGLIRIGYAGGTRTHQKDFAQASAAVAKLLRERAKCRLVLFRTPQDLNPLVNVEEFSELAGLEQQIEWRPMQPLELLPYEMVRFDINIAPLELQNPFCEAKSQLKFFEAAIVNVPTIASPTEPFRSCITHGVNGFLASSSDEWLASLRLLADDSGARKVVANDAHYTAMREFGDIKRNLLFGCVLDQLAPQPKATRSFALTSFLKAKADWPAPFIPEHEVLYAYDKGGQARVTVIVPLYNYAEYIAEALDSVKAQTERPLDLIVVDDRSTDDSRRIAREWMENNRLRFNRAILARNKVNSGLAYTRNVGFHLSETSFILPLDADNRLLPECCERLSDISQQQPAAFIYPQIRTFGSEKRMVSDLPWNPQILVAGNYIDAMALVSKQAWAIVGGYDHLFYGWEDYDLWCKFVETGLSAVRCEELLAEYRVHPASMTNTRTQAPATRSHLYEDFKKRHPWVSLLEAVDHAAGEQNRH